eukprot:TRINITY_DN74209_c0_g1_i1.p1 TRINITY_DN74209_c0_g1~~TRINITY_DN74209_c0_g1_i1.p1  ORF type:complete len:946 (+),score=202.46 TRINITY_DN74209_c0_g1_i1:122-2959(+)
MAMMEIKRHSCVSFQATERDMKTILESLGEELRRLSELPSLLEASLQSAWELHAAAMAAQSSVPGSPISASMKKSPSLASQSFFTEPGQSSPRLSQRKHSFGACSVHSGTMPMRASEGPCTLPPSQLWDSSEDRAVDASGSTGGTAVASDNLLTVRTSTQCRTPSLCSVEIKMEKFEKQTSCVAQRVKNNIESATAQDPQSSSSSRASSTATPAFDRRQKRSTTFEAGTNTDATPCYSGKVVPAAASGGPLQRLQSSTSLLGPGLKRNSVVDVQDKRRRRTEERRRSRFSSSSWEMDQPGIIPSSLASRRASCASSHEGSEVFLSLERLKEQTSDGEESTSQSDNECPASPSRSAVWDRQIAGQLPSSTSILEKAVSSSTMGVSKTGSIEDHHLGWALGGGDSGKEEMCNRFMRRASQSRQFSMDAVDDKSDYIISPSNPARLAWEVFGLLTTIVICFMAPVALAYSGDIIHTGRFATLLLVADALLILEVPINLRTGFIQEFELVTSPTIIAVRYLQGNFLLDLLSACPLFLVESFRDTIMEKVVLLTKFCRIVKLGPSIATLQQNFQSLSFLAHMKGLLLVFYLCHVMSCGWRAAQDADHEMSSIATERDWSFRYVADFYFIIATMTTVGYGDLHPTGMYTRVFCVFAMVLSTVAFGFLLNLVGRELSRVFDDEVEAKKREAMAFMRRREVPRELRDRVEQNLQQRLRQDTRMAAAPNLLAKLSPAVQRELALELLREVILRFPLFMGVSRAFACELAQAMIWLEAQSGDIVAQQGQSVRELCFVVQGRIVLLTPDAHHVMEEERGPGAWFGERSLFVSEYIRPCTAISRMDSELAVLPIDSYKSILRMFPRLRSRHKALQKAVNGSRRSLDELQYTPDADEGKGQTQWTRWPWSFRMKSESRVSKMRATQTELRIRTHTSWCLGADLRRADRTFRGTSVMPP